MSIRLVYKNYPDAFSHVGREVGLWEAYKENKVQSTFWLFKQPNALYALNNASFKFVDLDYARTTPYPIIRTPLFKSQIASIIIAGSGYNLITVADASLFHDDYKELRDFVAWFWINIVSDYGLSISYGNNDLIVDGTERKVSGFSNEVEALPDGRKVAFSNSFLTETKPESIDPDLLFKLPDSKFEGKKIKKPSERISSLKDETNQMFNVETLKARTKELLEDRFNDTVELVYEFTDYENEIADRTDFLTRDSWNIYNKYD